MKIIICCSISAAAEVIKIKDQLEAAGHEVEVPDGVKHEYHQGRTELATSEKATDKIEGDFFRRYFEKMKKYDAVLIVNPEKRGVPSYIGGNTFLEMGFAHVLNKELYVLNEIPEMSYSSEMLAMQPVELHGDLGKLLESK